MHAAHFFVVSYLLMSADAYANWQYTKWGMSVAQVAEASKGVARKNTDPTLNGEGFRTELVAPYRSGPYDFKVSFQFRPGKGLSSIELKAALPQECPAIKNALINKYGKPHDTAPSIGLIKWWDRPSGNIVIAFSIGDTYCAISYQPLAAPGASDGL